MAVLCCRLVELTVGKMVIEQANIGQAGIAQPDIAQPDIAQPDIAQPDIAQADIAQVEALAPLRVMLVCCDELVPELLQAYLAQTQWWQPADGDICYGELQLYVLVLTQVAAAQSGANALADVSADALAGVTQQVCGMQLERLPAVRLQHDWFILAAEMARIQQLALQQDWLVFVDPERLVHGGPDDRSEQPSSIAMLQLLLAEHLHAALRSCAPEANAASLTTNTRLSNAANPPVFIQCRWERKPAHWPDFYQQLDLNSRWQSLIDCRWLMTYPALASESARPAPSVQQQADYFAAQLYLLLLAGLPSVIGPWLDALAPRYLSYLSAEPPTATPRLTKQSWLDWQVLPGIASPMHNEVGEHTQLAIEYQLPADCAYNADVQLTAIAVQQGTLLGSMPTQQELPCSHHLLSQLRVCLKQLPAQLPVTHVLLLQCLRARPQWQLQGYWRLRLA